MTGITSGGLRVRGAREDRERATREERGYG